MIKQIFLDAKTWIYAVFTYLNLDFDVVQILGYLMIIDTFLGSVKAISIDKIDFRFRVLLVGFVSKGGILLLPFTLALVAKGLSYDFNWFLVTVLDILIVSEAISIIGNTIAIKTKKPIKNFDAVTVLLKAIRNSLISLFNRFIKKLENPKDEEEQKKNP